MTRRTAKAAALATLMLVSLLSFPAVAGGTRFWFGGSYDRSPNAVKERFNALSNEWSVQERGGLWPSPPKLINTATSNKHDFFYYQDEPATPMTGEDVKFTITGQAGADGRVEVLAIQMAPLGSFGEPYLRAGDQLMQLAALSMFDKLDEKTNRNIALLFSYDIRPFHYRDIGDALPIRARSIRSVINDLAVEFSAEALAHDQLNLTIRVNGQPTQEEIDESKSNDACNRNLSQAHTECHGLRNCAEELVRLAADDEADWYAIEAVAEQIDECLNVIDELNKKLILHQKSLIFAQQLGEQCALMKASHGRLLPLISKQDQAGIAEMLPEMVLHAQEMGQLIWLARE